MCSSDLAAAKREQDVAAAAVTTRRDGVEQLARLKDGVDGKLADLRQDVSRMQTSLVGVSRQLATRVSDAAAIRRDVTGATAAIKAVIAELSAAPRAGGSTGGGSKRK